MTVLGNHGEFQHDCRIKLQPRKLEQNKFYCRKLRRWEPRKVPWTKFAPFIFFKLIIIFLGDGHTNRRHYCRCLKCCERKERISSIVTFAKLISTGFAFATINFRQCFSPGEMGPLILSVPLQWAAWAARSSHYIRSMHFPNNPSQPARHPARHALHSHNK